MTSIIFIFDNTARQCYTKTLIIFGKYIDLRFVNICTGRIQSSNGDGRWGWGWWCVGMDGDGDKYPSPCSSSLWSAGEWQKLQMIPCKNIGRNQWSSWQKLNGIWSMILPVQIWYFSSHICRQSTVLVFRLAYLKFGVNTFIRKEADKA